MTTAAVVFSLGLVCGWAFGGSKHVSTDRAKAEFTGHAAPADAARVRSPEGAAKPLDSFIARLADALGHASRSQRNRALEAIADDLDAAQIRAALGALDEMRVADREKIRTSLLARWGELEPNAAAEYALGLPHAKQREDSIAAVINGWLEHDPQGAATWIAALPEDRTKNVAQEALIIGVAAGDPEQALALLRETPPSLISAIMKRDWMSMLDAIFNQWAQDQPAQAAAAAMQLDESLRDGASFRVGRAWADRDLAKALEWARSATEPPQHEISQGTMERTAVTGVLHTWMRKDPDAAIQWLTDLPAGNERANLIQSAYLQSSFDDPSLAIELAQLLPKGEAQEYAFGSATRTWTRFDPAGALQWATEQPAGTARDVTLRTAAAEWLGSDFKGASTWIANIPAGAEKDQMLGEAVRLIVKGEQVGRSGSLPSIDRMPGDAYTDLAQLVGQIGDVAKRHLAFEQLASAWLRKNPEAARAWIGSSPLPADVQERLIRKQKSNPQ